MNNIEIALKYVCEKQVFHMHFSFDEENEIFINTTNNMDDSQHDFSLTKDDYLYLREQFDKHFNIRVEQAFKETNNVQDC
ncbi:hypothetical protein FZC76_21740 [Sutcliffiella horikoshii]|uniref:Uncharacterized protein n=1 Tax=Sutcliffiella horikoshii TaxID=79883 RepID=A0A5D4SFC2_9BACI|nr:hypothetical protein [Sutcliffiella horikoshii]TYS60496.1 hypothetical protein FZC76_21740 [Sutcliffiella horikoshii]